MSSVMRARALAAALDAALDLGILTAIGRAPMTDDDVATACGLDRAACARILAVLEAEGFLERAGACLDLSSGVRRELRAPELLRGESRLWSHVPDFAATGRTLDRGTGGDDRGAAYHDSTPHLARMFAPAAAELAARLAPRLSGRTAPRVLDVGAGSGVWSLAVVEAVAPAIGRGLDLEPVLPRFLERAAALGVADRVEAIAGDFHTATVDGPHDLVFLANVLHLESPDRAARLISRWGEAVAPDGSIVIVDMLGPSGPDPARAAYALHLALRVPGSRVHPEGELRGWLRETGFATVERVALEAEDGLGALLATR